MKLTRRNFTKDATAGVVGIATVSVLGGCSPKTEPITPTATHQV